MPTAAESMYPNGPSSRMGKPNDAPDFQERSSKKKLKAGDTCPTCGGKITEEEPAKREDDGWKEFMQEKMKGKDYKGVPF